MGLNQEQYKKLSVMECCEKVGLIVEKFEICKGMRLHCVVRKKTDEKEVVL
jgi:hypothetical protein